MSLHQRNNVLLWMMFALSVIFSVFIFSAYGVPSAKKTAVATTMQLTAASTTFRSFLTTQYAKYAVELREMRVKAAHFCSTPKPKGWPHTNKCLSSVTEMELLYMQVRETRPAKVLEIASAIGFTSLWLLAALAANGEGVLHSFDVYRTPFPPVLDASIEAKHWAFTLGDVYQTYAPTAGAMAFPIMLMDAEHTREFGAFYRDNVLVPQLERAQATADETNAIVHVHITVHDCYHFETNYLGVSAEGEVFIKWIGSLGPMIRHNCWTANPFVASRRHALLTDIQEAAMGEEANALKFGAFSRGDLSIRCDFFLEPLPPARDCPLCEYVPTG